MCNAADIDIQSSERVLQVLASPSPAKKKTTSTRLSSIPNCTCHKVQNSPDDGSEQVDDVENQHCDICEQIAPKANMRKDMVDALRNFIQNSEAKESSALLTVTQEENREIQGKEIESVEVVEEEVTCDEIPIIESLDYADEPDVNSLPVSNLLGDLDMEMPHTENESHDNTRQVADKHEDAPPTAEVVHENSKNSCFSDTLKTCLATGRVRGRIVGRRLRSDFVEFIYKIQVKLALLNEQFQRNIDFLSRS